jgi:hypothetical protein
MYSPQMPRAPRARTPTPLVPTWPAPMSRVPIPKTPAQISGQETLFVQLHESHVPKPLFSIPKAAHSPATVAAALRFETYRTEMLQREAQPREQRRQSLLLQRASLEQAEETASGSRSRRPSLSSRAPRPSVELARR